MIWPWMITGAAAFIFALTNLFRAATGKHFGWEVLLFASFSSGGLSVLSALRIVNYWGENGDWSAIMDVVPTLTTLCTIAMWLGIALNLLALYLHLRTEKAVKGAKIDG